MNYKILVIMLAVLALVAAVSATATVKWTNQNGDTITSAYVGDTVRFVFDSVDNCTAPCYADELGVISFDEVNPYTGMWVDVPGFSYDPSQHYPAFTLQESGGNTSVTVPASTGFLVNNTRWKGWTNFTITQEDTVTYRGNYLRLSYLNPTWSEYTNTTLTVSKNPLLLTNINDVLRDIGGDGLRYFFGVIIIGILAFIPFFLMRQFNVFIEIIMIVLGVGISFLIGLFDLWVVFALGIGSLAVFLMLRNKVGG